MMGPPHCSPLCPHSTLKAALESDSPRGRERGRGRGRGARGGRRRRGGREGGDEGWEEEETRERRERQQPPSRPLPRRQRGEQRAESTLLWVPAPLLLPPLLAFPPSIGPMRSPVLMFPKFGSPQCSLLTPSAFLLLPSYPGRRQEVLGRSWGHCVHFLLPGAKHDSSSLLSGQTRTWQHQEGPLTASGPL